MTIGSKVDDFRTTVNGVPKVGSWWIKQWNGGDAPKVRKTHTPTPKLPRRARASRGEHAYTMSHESGLSPLTRVFPPSGSPYWSTTSSSLGFTPGSGWRAGDDYELINRLKLAIQGSDFDMSIFLGTSHQSIRLIGDTAVTIAKALRQVRRGNIDEAARTLGGKGRAPKGRGAPSSADAMSQRWLGLQYGWLPLLGDVKSAAEYAAHQLSAPCVKNYKVSLYRQALVPSPVSNSFQTRSGFRRTTVIAKIKEGDLPNSIAQLGLLDPENLLWEALPWSFVIDWFAPVGDWLSARAYAQKLSGTFITSTKLSGLSEKFQMYQAGWSVTGAESAYVKNVSFTRTISTSLSVPMPSVKNLTEVPSWKRAMNAIALLNLQKTRFAK